MMIILTRRRLASALFLCAAVAVTCAHSQTAKALYEEGLAHYNSGDMVEAADVLRRAAEAGEPRAMNHLGHMAQDGLGGPEDPGAAFAWYRQAAEAGDAYGLLNMGAVYREGLGVSQDDAEAVKWWRRAADAGSVEALTNLGFMYQHGLHVPRDEKRAIKLFFQAGQLGDGLAFHNMAIIFEEVSSEMYNADLAAQSYLLAGLKCEARTLSSIFGDPSPISTEVWRELQSLLAEEEARKGEITGIPTMENRFFFEEICVS